MAPPSQLSIATSSLLRLIKEEASYHKELQEQLARIESLDKEDENADYILKQEVWWEYTGNRYVHVRMTLLVITATIEEGHRGDKGNVS